MKSETIIQTLLGLLLTILLGLVGWNLKETVHARTDIAVIKEQVGVLSGRVSRVEQ